MIVFDDMIANVITLKNLRILTKQYTAKTYSSLMIDTTLAFDARVVSITKKGYVIKKSFMFQKQSLRKNIKGNHDNRRWD